MSPEFKAQKIAKLMVQVLKDIVWPEVEDLANEYDLAPAPLKGRVGVGKRTYHRLREEGRRRHEIVFGEKMVLAKMDPAMASGWTTGVEINEKGFFGGEMTYSNLLAHTIIHEASHALQVMAGDRHYREVHNEEFYVWLWRLHDRVGNHAQTVLSMLAEQDSLELEFSEGKRNRKSDLLSKEEMIPGKRYAFEGKGGLQQGVLRKVNRKSATIDVGATVYRVPLFRVRRVATEDYGVHPPQNPAAKAHAPAPHDVISGFEGRHFFLSTAFNAPINYQGLVFKTADHLFCWLTTDPKAPGWRNRILNADTAMLARNIWEGQQCPKVIADNWEEFQIKAMKRAVWEKFQNPALQAKLLKTDNLELLAENQEGDRLFGVVDGEGDNHLGKLLMAMRSYLKNKTLKVAS